MAAMRAVGNGHKLPRCVSVRESKGEYRITLDVSAFTQGELSVEALGAQIRVRGDQHETIEDEGKAFRLHERLEESFRLPDDVDADRITVYYSHGTLEIRAPRSRPGWRRLPVRRRPSLVNPDATPC